MGECINSENFNVFESTIGDDEIKYLKFGDDLATVSGLFVDALFKIGFSKNVRLLTEFGSSFNIKLEQDKSVILSFDGLKVERNDVSDTSEVTLKLSLIDDGDDSLPLDNTCWIGIADLTTQSAEITQQTPTPSPSKTPTFTPSHTRTPTPTNTPTPSPTRTPTPTKTAIHADFRNHYRVKDLSTHGRTGHLHGHIKDSGENRGLSTFASLGNDITNVEDVELYNPSEYIEQKSGSSIETNALTFALWVKFVGESKPSSTIIGTNPTITTPTPTPTPTPSPTPTSTSSYTSTKTSMLKNTPEQNTRCALIVNTNGEEGDETITGTIGYTWKNTKKDLTDGTSTWSYMDNTFEDVTIEKNKWTWLVLMLYPSGIARLFVDNIYRASIDEGHERDLANLKNLEVGRFSGDVDSVFVFSEILDYGDVEIGQEAKSELSYLYNTSRTKPFEPIRKTIPSVKPNQYDGLNFYYMQDEEYIESSNFYNTRTQQQLDSGQMLQQVLLSQTQESLNEQKFTIKGGVNDGTRTFADSKFMTFSGEMREME